MNLLLLLCFSRLSRSVTGRVHGPSVEMIGFMEQLGVSNWGVIGNWGSLEMFKLRIIWYKCRKKVVKGSGIFLRENMCRAWAITSMPEGVVRRLLCRKSEG